MKILLTELNSRGGINIFNKLLLKYLREKGLETEILTLPLICEPILDFVRFWEKLTKSIKTKLDYGEYDIVHTSSILGNLIEADVVTFHLLNSGEHYLKYRSFLKRFYWNSWIKRQEKKSINKAKAVIAVSRYTANKVKEVHGILPEVIYNGIDIDQFRPLNLSKDALLKELDLPLDYLNKKIILFVGNATIRKGFDILRSVMNLLDNSYICLTCGLRISKSFDKIVSLKELPDNKMPLLYNLCDIYFHPARLEGFGLTVAEAMACLKPVICSNISSLPELIINRKGGILCDLGPQDFKQAIEYLMNNPGLRQEMGEFNRERCVKDFDYRMMGDNYLSLYKTVLT